MSTDPVLPARTSACLSSSHNLLRIQRFSSIFKMRTRNVSNIVLSVSNVYNINQISPDGNVQLNMRLAKIFNALWNWREQPRKGNNTENGKRTRRRCWVQYCFRSILQSSLLNKQAGITLRMFQCASTCCDIMLNRPNEIGTCLHVPAHIVTTN